MPNRQIALPLWLPLDLHTHTHTPCHTQVEGLIYFEDSLEQLVQWDKQVATVCVKVDSILDTLNAAAAAPAMA
jgi:hypothetical protein